MEKQITRRDALLWTPPIVLAIILPQHAQATSPSCPQPIAPPFPRVESLSVIEGDCISSPATATSTAASIGNIQKFSFKLFHGYYGATLTKLELPANTRLIEPTLPVILNQRLTVMIETTGGHSLACSSRMEIVYQIQAAAPACTGSDRIYDLNGVIDFRLP